MLLPNTGPDEGIKLITPEIHENCQLGRQAKQTVVKIKIIAKELGFQKKSFIMIKAPTRRGGKSANYTSYRFEIFHFSECCSN